mgnify:CR=1 FL=1
MSKSGGVHDVMHECSWRGFEAFIIIQAWMQFIA